MRAIATKVFLGLFALMLFALPSDGSGADRGRGCRGSDRLRIEDLDVSPDPLVHGQRIRSWRVRVRLNSDRERETEIMVREGNEMVGRARNYTLRPGINEVEIQPAETYRFQRNEHCFDVIVDLEGSGGAWMPIGGSAPNKYPPDRCASATISAAVTSAKWRLATPRSIPSLAAVSRMTLNVRTPLLVRSSRKILEEERHWESTEGDGRPFD
ncbi:MAG TPA: hypothetical protein VE689_05285 [Candidatus Udaeobacter sp.]|nr:hypothetical protein [Candidatus Udaeobacter sp.]